MIFESYLSLKYLFCKRKEKFISLIAFLSIGGVTISVMSLIVVIAVMSGFSENFKEKIIGMNPHIVVSTDGLVQAYDDNVKRIEKIPGITGVYPYVEGQAMLHHNNKIHGILLKGIYSGSKDITSINKYLHKGVSTVGDGEILLGYDLAKDLLVNVGDSITILSPAYGYSGNDFPPSITFLIKGIFKSDYQYDSTLVFITLKDSQKLYGLLPSQVHGIGIEIDDVEKAHIFKQKIADYIREGWFVKSWMDINKNFFAALKTEKNVMFILLTLAVLVAATNIVSTLVMVVLEKTKEIGILKSMGMSDFGIMKIFVFEGAFIGLTGSLLGGVFGIVFVYWLDAIESVVSKLTGLEVFPRDVYYFDSIPAKLEVMDVTMILVIAFVVTMLAALYPAWKASKLSPVEAIRYE